ncbi:uncharacterized protein LY89DRAFT_682755 [Mollisia scopiformis]|uniref:Chitin-binding type-1 domain-containing protein n=1 Tax=Mollisia scopiformis TaxID=149040 RepID=A0A194XII2_MOLSC|nr:uncharacterized protein LY89DRAFT_682755 [Mollisia scopiformis]KUJ19929.1 hypothetical protein LY89DRAFT_682755 [Mollisia scopiformis]
MRTNIVSLAFGLTLATLSYALSSDDATLHPFLSKRVVSPDNTCGDVYGGANNGYTCDASVNAGGCCSQYGYCGISMHYCSTGCQSDFGNCSVASTQPTDDTLTCGPSNGNLQCDSELRRRQEGAIDKVATSSTPSPSKTSSKASAASQTSTSSCEMENGSWCGRTNTFSNQQSCQQAYVNCYGQTVKCMGGGSQNLGVCTTWTQTCFNLNAYCQNCSDGEDCHNAGFVS